MNWSLMVLWGAVGWCGTPWRKWPPPPPDPDPWWRLLIAIGGGILGGWGFSAVWPQGAAEMSLYAAASSVGALAGSVIVQDIVGRARGGARG
jgi:hypothetical protein